MSLTLFRLFSILCSSSRSGIGSSVVSICLCSAFQSAKEDGVNIPTSHAAFKKSA